MRKSSIIPFCIVIIIGFLMVVGIVFLNDKLQPIFIANESEEEINEVIKLLPEAEEFSPYTGEILPGISSCYIETTGLGMVTISTIEIDNIPLEIYIGINQDGYITGVEIEGDDFDTSALAGVISDEYLTTYIGIEELSENSVQDDGRFDAKPEALELSESVYGIAKLALEQYGEIYE